MAENRLKSPTEKPVHVALLSGNSILIGPDGRDVPAMFYREALICGAVPEGMQASDMEVEAAAPTELSRKDLMRNGIKKMMETREDGDFTGAGLPDRRILSRIVGWSVTAVELAEVWQEFNDA